MVFNKDLSLTQCKTSLFLPGQETIQLKIRDLLSWNETSAINVLSKLKILPCLILRYKDT